MRRFFWKSRVDLFESLMFNWKLQQDFPIRRRFEEREVDAFFSMKENLPNMVLNTPRNLVAI